MSSVQTPVKASVVLTDSYLHSIFCPSKICKLLVVTRETPGAITDPTIDAFVQSVTVPDELTILYCTLNLAAAVDELVLVTLKDAAL